MKDLLIVTNHPKSIITEGLSSIFHQSEIGTVNIINHKSLDGFLLSTTALLVFIWNLNEKMYILEALIKLNNAKSIAPILIVCNTIICKADFKLIQNQTVGRAIIDFNTSKEEMFECIDKLLINKGRWIMSTDIITSLLDNLLIEDRTDTHIYTGTEQKIIELAKQGASIIEMASALHLSKNTIAAYRSKLLQRSGAKSMGQLIFELQNKPV